MIAAASLYFALTFQGGVPQGREAGFALGRKYTGGRIVEGSKPEMRFLENVRPRGFSLTEPVGGRGYLMYEPGPDFRDKLRAALGLRNKQVENFLYKIDLSVGDYSEQLLSYNMPLDYRVGLLRKRIAGARNH